MIQIVNFDHRQVEIYETSGSAINPPRHSCMEGKITLRVIWKFYYSLRSKKKICRTYAFITLHSPVTANHSERDGRGVLRHVCLLACYFAWHQRRDGPHACPAVNFCSVWTMYHACICMTSSQSK
jgi:hypothetical protein